MRQYARSRGVTLAEMCADFLRRGTAFPRPNDAPYDVRLGFLYWKSSAAVSIEAAQRFVADLPDAQRATMAAVIYVLDEDERKSFPAPAELDTVDTIACTISGSIFGSISSEVQRYPTTTAKNCLDDNLIGFYSFSWPKFPIKVLFLRRIVITVALRQLSYGFKDVPARLWPFLYKRTAE